jgi:hypothetical protein
MSDERANRLRDKRKQAKEKATGQTSEPDEESEPSDTSEQSKPSKPSGTDETDERDEPSVKEERVGTYMYLPPSQKEDINRYYSKKAGDFEFETGDELEKNRHWYPLVVRYGLDELREADAERIAELLDEADLR